MIPGVKAKTTRQALQLVVQTLVVVDQAEQEHRQLLETLALFLPGQKLDALVLASFKGKDSLVA